MIRRIITSVREQLRGETLEGEKITNRSSLAQEMKRSLISIAIILLVSLAAWLIRGNALDIYVPYLDGTPADKIAVSFEPDGVAYADSVEAVNGYVHVRAKKLAAGETLVTIAQGEATFSVTLHASGHGLLTNMSNNNFSGWYLIVGAATLCCLAVGIIFLTGFLLSVRTELFSYTTATKLAVSMMFLLLGFMGTVLTVMYVRDPSYYSFFNFTNAVSNAALFFTVFTLPLIAVLAVTLCVSNISLIRHEGFRPVNALGIIISLAIALGFALGLGAYNYLNLSFDSMYLFRVLTNSYFSIYAFFISQLTSIFILFFIISRREPAYDKEFIVILGCAIRKDGTLYPLIRGRVDRALQFAESQEKKTGLKAYFIPSGGQGEDEIMPEAEAMAAYLRSKGIPEERILPETRSTNTIENMRFSREIAKSRGDDSKTVFSTTNYHVFRSGILAGKIGWKPDGMGSPTKWYFWPNALIREFIGLIVDDFFGILTFCLILIAFSFVTALF